MAPTRPTLCVDFDGVIAEYISDWELDKFGAPVAGAAESLNMLRGVGWMIIIHTTRKETPEFKKWLHRHHIPYDHINFHPENFEQHCGGTKPLATVYLDDRGMRFDGVWDDSLINSIATFQPWYRR